MNDTLFACPEVRALDPEKLYVQVIDHAKTYGHRSFNHHADRRHDIASKLIFLEDIGGITRPVRLQLMELWDRTVRS